MINRNRVWSTYRLSTEEAELQTLKKETEDLQKTLQEARSAVNDASLATLCQNVPEVSKLQVKGRRILKGHIAKVNAVHFAADSKHLVSGSLDGRLIIWDTWSSNKVRIIQTSSSWIMTAAFETQGRLVATGGMDNACSLYNLAKREGALGAPLMRQLTGFDGYLAAVRFVDETKIIAGCGDSKVTVWDIERGLRLAEFDDHDGDVVGLDVFDKNIFLTGSIDRTSKLWDLREKCCQQTFQGHLGDVNGVKFHRSGHCFVTSSEDSTARLFDIRSDQEIGQYTQPSDKCAFTSCAMSSSGRLILCGADDDTIHIWDTLRQEHLGNLWGHDNRVTSLSVTDNGMALATGSWDTTIRIWS